MKFSRELPYMSSYWSMKSKLVFDIAQIHVGQNCNVDPQEKLYNAKNWELICLKENWWVPNFAFIKISILKTLVLFVIPSLIRRHSELLGIEILLNTQTPENGNFTTKVFWVFEGLLETKTLNVMISYENIQCFLYSMFSSILKTIFYMKPCKVLGIEVLLHTPKPWMWSILMRQHAGFRVLLKLECIEEAWFPLKWFVVDVVWKCGGDYSWNLHTCFWLSTGNHLFWLNK